MSILVAVSNLLLPALRNFRRNDSEVSEVIGNVRNNSVTSEEQVPCRFVSFVNRGRFTSRFEYRFGSLSITFCKYCQNSFTMEAWLFPYTSHLLGEFLSSLWLCSFDRDSSLTYDELSSSILFGAIVLISQLDFIGVITLLLNLLIVLILSPDCISFAKSLYIKSLLVVSS